MGKFPVSNSKEVELLQRMASLAINENDLIENFIRGSGAGGQKINKTSSTVQLIHKPSGIEVRCQRERSQALNRFFARRELCDKLEGLLLREKSRKQMAIEKIRRQKRRRSRKAKEKMLKDKHQRGKMKTLRSRVSPDE